MTPKDNVEAAHKAKDGIVDQQSNWTWFSSRQSYASVVLSLAALAVACAAKQATSTSTFDHVKGVMMLPGMMMTLLLSLVAPYVTFSVVKTTKDAFQRKGFVGRDLLKGNADQIPETLGLPTSIVYCMLMCAFIPFRYGMQQEYYNERLQTNEDGGWNGNMLGRSGFPHHELSSYLSSLLSIFSSIMLGFLDDVFDIRWRLKMPIPILASLPMLVVYQAGQGGTSVVVPGWPAVLRRILGASVINLGLLYHVFIMLLSVFCVHSINILAGINGVEVGQALVIALSLCCNDILYLDPRAGQAGSFASVELRDRHLFSLSLLLPFCGCCIGLLAWNKFPARVFVGDTFCYFAGQVLACAGVLGHFSKTLLLFFVPQLFNFVLSLPQLFGLVPCPRHRVPNVDLITMRVHPSVARFSSEKPASPLAQVILQLFNAFRFVHLEWEQDTSGKGRLVSSTNLTILNAILVFRGVRPLDSSKSDQARGARITEEGLWYHVMIIQSLCSIFAFAVRYRIAAIVFP